MAESFLGMLSRSMIGEDVETHVGRCIYIIHVPTPFPFVPVRFRPHLADEEEKEQTHQAELRWTRSGDD